MSRVKCTKHIAAKHAHTPNMHPQSLRLQAGLEKEKRLLYLVRRPRPPRGKHPFPAATQSRSQYCQDTPGQTPTSRQQGSRKTENRPHPFPASLAEQMPAPAHEHAVSSVGTWQGMSWQHRNQPCEAALCGWMSVDR